MLIVCSVFILGAWTPFSSHKQKLESVLTKIDLHIDQFNWNKAKSDTRQFTKIYEKEKWLLQLLGDEGEYEEMNHSINKLKAALQTKDDTEAKMEIANIEAVIEEIFSL